MFAECIEKRVHPATWAVIGYKKGHNGTQMSQRGTAFAVDTHGHMLTCWHVTYADSDNDEELLYLEVLQPELDLKRLLRARIVGRDKDRDLALLKLEDDTERTIPVQLNAGPRIRWGQSCCAFGHPLSVTGKAGIRIFTRAGAGILSTPMISPRFNGCREIRLYEVDFFTHGGMSGGALFLPSGCVFGVVSGSRMLDDNRAEQVVRSNLSIAIDIAEAMEFLHGLGVKPQLAGHVGGNVVSKKPKRHKSSRRGRRHR